MRREGVIGRAATAALVALALALAGFVAGGAGAAEAPPKFASFPEDGVPGEAAGELNEPTGIAYNPANSRIYVSDTRNRRISAFSAWGEFLFAFGWGVRDGAAEAQRCDAESGCRAGLEGDGPGQFGKVEAASSYTGPTGLATDSSGAMYAMDLGNFRVQKFDSEGNFALTFGGGVNETTGGDVCTAASGDDCGAGQPGSGPGEIGIENVTGVVGDYVVVAPDDRVYVADKDRVQVFGPGGGFERSFALPEEGNPGAMDLAGDGETVYFAFAQKAGNSQQPGVHRLDPDTGVPVGPTLAVEKPVGLASAASGDLYVASHPAGQAARVEQFDAAGEPVGEFGELGSALGLRMGAIGSGQVGAGAGEVDIYAAEFEAKVSSTVSQVHVYGATPDPEVVGPPPKAAPEIAEQFATSVDARGAVVRAKINPRFWSDTTYYVEYGPQPCGEGLCASAPAPPGSRLTEQVTNAAVRSAGVFLGDLSPGQSYHYRFVAQSGGSEGQPVRGVGGEVGEAGAEGTFTTRPLPAPPRTSCPNQAFRGGPGARLPDCRAYEMVSPADKGDSDVIVLLGKINLPARSQRATAQGERLTYSAFKAFDDPVSSPYSSQYLTERVAGEGWRGRSISPPRSGVTLNSTLGLEVQFKDFSADLCRGWLVQDTALLLAPGAVAGYPNLYSRELCVEGGYEAVTRVKPPARIPAEYLPEAQGSSADGARSFFRANDKLSADAPAGSALKTYEQHGGQTRLVCKLPGGSGVAGCSVGTASGSIPALNVGHAVLEDAVSEDGQRVYWTHATSGPGKLYVREGAASTTAVSAGAAEFLGASPDGGRAIYREAGALYAFEPGMDAPEGGAQIVGELVGTNGGVVGMSEDAETIYLVSREARAAGAVAGKPNLYRYREGGFVLIATLAEADIDAALTPTSSEPYHHAGRVSPDGGAVAFISRNELTGQDATDQNSGEADSQVYLWREAEGKLRCVSCNRTGARPLGADIDTYKGGIPSPFWAAGLLPTSESEFYSPRALASDGRRLFFESFDRLVAHDTNGTLDVYQWEAQGKGDCAEPEGCVSLISSGESPQRSEFVDASADGSDVFFATASSLVEGDPGLIDIYDARAGGGFAAPPAPAPPCRGEACQSPPPAPEAPTPGSASYVGPGNIAPQPPSRCRRPARAAKRMSRKAKRARRAARRAKAPARRRALRRRAKGMAKGARKRSVRAKRCRARARADRRAAR